MHVMSHVTTVCFPIPSFLCWPVRMDGYIQHLQHFLVSHVYHLHDQAIPCLTVLYVPGRSQLTAERDSLIVFCSSILAVTFYCMFLLAVSTLRSKGAGLQNETLQCPGLMQIAGAQLPFHLTSWISSLSSSMGLESVQAQNGSVHWT